MTAQIVPHSNKKLSTALATVQDNSYLLTGLQEGTSRYSRVQLYVQWLDASGWVWVQPDLASYADYLLSGDRVIDHAYKGTMQQNLSPRSVKAHLSSIRGQYKSISSKPDFKDKLRAIAQAMTPQAGRADVRATYLDLLETITDAMNPELTKHIKVTKKQDTVDSEHIRLTDSQAQALVEAPSLDTLMGLRDTALIYLMLATGLREHEICALNVEDLRQTVNSKLGVYVKDGKGAKARFVPYGELSDCLAYVDAWLAQANISEGAVFRGFKDRHIGKAAPNSKSPSVVYSRLTDRLNVRSINHILKQYPVSIEGELRTINPHDTRRSYARLQYDNGMDMLAIRDNLGHADVKTTQGYIGDMNMDKRQGKRIFKVGHDRKKLATYASVPKLDIG